MSASPALTVEDRGPVRVLTLNRPDKLNAMSSELHDGLLTALQDLRTSSTARVAVLTGSGRAFSAGGDMELIKRMQDDRSLRDATMATARELFEEFTTLSIPVVAAVNGAAVGAGCTLALLCDVVIMDKTSFLSDARVTVGLVPGDGGSILWPLLAGLSTAKAYLLTGDRISAAEAWRLGLIHQVVDSDSLGAAMVLAERIASRPAFAVRETKRALDLHLTASRSIFDYAMEAESRCFDDEGHRRAIP
jgi:enoyl-CoA hydratase